MDIPTKFISNYHIFNVCLTDCRYLVDIIQNTNCHVNIHKFPVQCVELKKNYIESKLSNDYVRESNCTLIVLPSQNI